VQFPLAVIPPFLLYRPVLRVVGSWGFPQVPAEIKQACMDTVAYWIERDVEHYTQDLGVQTTETAGTVIIGRGQYPTKILPLPPEVHSRVAQYQPTCSSDGDEEPGQDRVRFPAVKEAATRRWQFARELA
jgi:hypothetical protein